MVEVISDRISTLEKMKSLEKSGADVAAEGDYRHALPARSSAPTEKLSLSLATRCA